MTRKSHPEKEVDRPKEIAPEARARTEKARRLEAEDERYWSSLPLGASEDARRFPEEHGEEVEED
jgi:hypothetical protein